MSSSSVLEELDPRMLALSEALFTDMDVRNLNKTVKVKVSRAILHFIDQFIQDLITVSGYAMKLEPTIDEARYCILHLWRKSHLRANVLAEAQLEESLEESFEVEYRDDEDYVPGREDQSDDESFSSYDNDNDEDASSDVSIISGEENESLGESDRASDVSDSEVNLDWSFESEASAVQQSSATIIENDFVSELMHYCQTEIQQRFRTNFIIRRPIAEMFAYFLSQQLQLSFQNDSDSLFIRAGYPAFGLMSTIYSQKEELREMRQLLEKQSSILQNAEQLREEFKNVTAISENIKAVARNLNLESFNKEKITAENVAIHQSNLSGEEEDVTFFTPSRLQQKTPSSVNVRDNADSKDKDIENLKTALKTEKESNFYLRLRHEELKLVMGRLNDLVYGKDVSSVSAPRDSNNLDKSKTNININNNSTSRSFLPGEIDRTISNNNMNNINNNSIDDIIHNSEDSDTDDEYQRQHLPPVHSLVNATFSPPAILVKHSNKKRSLSHASLQEANDRSGNTEDKESPILRYSYEFQERTDLVGHVQRSHPNENLPPIKRARRSLSLHARQQQPGPHTPTMFDR